MGMAVRLSWAQAKSTPSADPYAVLTSGRAHG
jgi:hypothetical protein